MTNLKLMWIMQLKDLLLVDINTILSHLQPRQK